MAGGYPGNPQVEELQRRREKLRQEIKEVEAPRSRRLVDENYGRISPFYKGKEGRLWETMMIHLVELW